MNGKNVTPRLITAVQSTIVNSTSLTKKIKKYILNLTITRENIERVSQVLSSDYIRRYILEEDEKNILSKTLIRDQKSEYYIDWFQYFLAKNQIWQKNSVISRKQFFKLWVNSSMYSVESLSFILKQTDDLIAICERSLVDDEFRKYILENLVNFCFSSGNF